MKYGIQYEKGQQELAAARRESRGLYWLVGLFSVFGNLLMLTGPIYMLQIYDRVLSSRSVETLLALSVLVAFLYGIMGILDYARGRVMGRVAARFQARLDRRVFEAVVRKSAVTPDETTATGLSDLEAVQRLLSSPVLLTFFDIPWTPLFLAGIWLFHPWLGTLALVGGALLILVTLVNQWATKSVVLEAGRATVEANRVSDQIRNEAEMFQAIGMRDAGFARWQDIRRKALHGQIRSADRGGSFSSATKVFRLFLQSAMLGLGAYLVLRGELTAGAMIAGSILLGRALAPIEQAIGQWQLVQRASKGWHSLAMLLGAVPEEQARLDLPVPEARLEVQKLTVLPPNEQQAVLKLVSFSVTPGQAIGVIGPSGAGKSSLARALTGVWRPAGGKIRLGGASLDQYSADVLGRHIGYLPQRVQLFDGTISENIAKLSQMPEPEKVVAAARMADAHEMILKLPDGYNTRVSATGGKLSGGQMQRIGLARAVYDDPVLLILDEPNSNLDNAGSMAVNKAVHDFKARNRSVLIMAHRPAAIQECDMLLVLDNGSVSSFGPRDQVLREVVQNHAEILQPGAKGGVR